MADKLYIKTFGCQMNEYDSEKMADVLRESHGYELTDAPENAVKRIRRVTGRVLPSFLQACPDRANRPSRTH